MDGRSLGAPLVYRISLASPSFQRLQDSRLPVEQRLVAGHPVPLPINSVHGTPISEHDASRIISIEAADGKPVLPVAVSIHVAADCFNVSLDRTEARQRQ